MRQYKMWNVVKSPDYATLYGKSFGANDYTTTTVNVGTSSKNSFKFLDHSLERETNEDGTMTFKFIVDGECIKESIYDPKTKELKKVN
jgi:hypothetical protein